MTYYDRKEKRYKEEKEYQDKTLRFLYHTVFGRFLLWLIVARPWFSNLKTRYYHSPKSKKEIVPFIKKYGIAEDDSETYKTFNDFFTRKKNLTFKKVNENIIVSPADSKMQYFNITEDLILHIKNSYYNIADILDNKEKAKQFSGGTCLVFRLCIDDYHRYHFVDNGKVIHTKKVAGKLHTIRSISEKYKVFSHNSREISILETENFGTIAQIEIGALLVGKINNHKKEKFKKYEEKGYFEFGGSTIVLLFKEQIKFDKDIEKANVDGYETKVSVGERIGICLKD